MNKSYNSNVSLLSAALLFCAALPAMAQSTVLTGKVERSGSRVKLLPATPGTVQQGSVTAAQQPQYAPPPAPRQTVVVEKPVVRTVYMRDNRSFWQKHPKVRAATIGAGVGTGAGAVTGLVSRQGVVRGAAIGAGTGAGVGLVRSSDTLRRHPIIKDVSTGALTGLGLSAAASRRGNTVLKGTGVGAAVGLGAGLLRDGLR